MEHGPAPPIRRNQSSDECADADGPWPKPCFFTYFYSNVCNKNIVTKKENSPVPLGV